MFWQPTYALDKVLYMYVAMFILIEIKGNLFKTYL